MLKVQIQFSKVLTRWNHVEGAGTEMQGGYADYMNFVETINSVDEVENLLVQHLENHGFENPYLTIVDDGTIGINAIENSAGSFLNLEEQEEYHKLGKIMFLCDYTAHIKLLVVNSPDINSLKQMFPKAEY